MNIKFGVFKLLATMAWWWSNDGILSPRS